MPKQIKISAVRWIREEPWMHVCGNTKVEGGGGGGALDRRIGVVGVVVGAGIRIFPT